MVARSLLLLILLTVPFFPAFASMCVECHKPHYEDKGSCSACHRGIETTSRKNIAHSGMIGKNYADFRINEKALKSGKTIIETAHCRRCHIVGGKGNSVGKNLDVESRRENIDSLKDKIINPTAYMPNFHLNLSDTDDVLKYILNSGLNAQETSKTEPYVVFITQGKKSVFEDKCGGCHRLLSRIKGGIGHGDTAPNLSGLLTEFFPTDTIEKKAKHWDRELLREWIKNPRKIDPLSAMPPVELTKDEEKSVIDEFD